MTRLSVDPATFAEEFDRRPFYVTHQLADHPLLQLESIAALAERLAPNLLEWNSGEPQGFIQPDAFKPRDISCRDAILQVERRPVRVLLLQIEHDPAYKRLLDELLDDIAPLSERIRPGMRQRQGFLFVSSRASYTPFHFDPEYNFLLQVRGRKTVSLWDPADRTVLPTATIDNYYSGISGDIYENRHVPFREDFGTRAWTLPMEAGQGVHFPLHAPHAVRTESDVSISLSITFQTRISQYNAMVHGANGHVRRLGLSPPAPGTSRLWDAAANIGYRGIRKSASLSKRVFSTLLPRRALATSFTPGPRLD